MNTRRAAACLIGGLLATGRVAAEVPSGYAFDNPRLLAHQLIWGRLHGVRLLGLACRDRGDSTAAMAYVDWLDRQWPRIRAAELDLARHYFKRRQAPLPALDAALRLPAALDNPGPELAAACASLPEALGAARNDLEQIYAGRRQAIRAGDPEFPGTVWRELDD